ncbi:MAG: MFS transporter [Elusimicrobia bacterium]|nr:MFS transporter [Elusimicrobiota bacterium]
MSPGDAPVETGAKVVYAFRALKNRDFRIFFAGQLVSLVGTWMQSTAQAWLVYRLTGSGFLLGAVAFAGQFPVLVFGPVGGAAADRYSRHRIVVLTQTASMLLAGVLAGLTLAHTVRVWHICAIAALLGVVNSFDIPARQAFVTGMVSRKDLINAIALNSTMFNSARIIGPAVAGILVGSVGEGWCFLANALSFLAVIASLMMMDVVERPLPARGASPLEEMLEGVRFVRRTAPVAALLLLLGLVSLVGMPYAVLMPIFADRVLHGGPTGLGILMASVGLGALLGSVSLLTRSGARGLGRLTATSTAGFGATLILFGLSRSFWLSAALLVPVGCSIMVHMASSNTLIQSMVPDGLRGRVMALFSMMFMGLAPFGSLLAGALAHAVGAPMTVAAGGAVCLAGGAVFALRLPALRPELRRLLSAQEGTPPPTAAPAIDTPPAR